MTSATTFRMKTPTHIRVGKIRLPHTLRILSKVVLAATLIAVLVALTPHQTARAWYALNQDSCSALAPNPYPNNVPSGWGQPMLNPATGGAATWSWDGKRYIVACNNKLVPTAAYNGITSLSGGHDQYAPPYSPAQGSQTHGYGAAFQCVELILRYAFARWNINPSYWNGNASTLYFNHPSIFTTYADQSNNQPAIGDIVVYGPVDSNGTPQPNWGPGHIAIIASIDWSLTNGYPTLTMFEQNFGSTYGFHTEYFRALHVDNTVYYSLGNDVFTGKPAFYTGPGGTDMRDDANHVVYGWMRGS